eukprot:COSAG05_NODE_7_length_42457_cov_58.929152_42_plen_99_part_00
MDANHCAVGSSSSSSSSQVVVAHRSIFVRDAGKIGRAKRDDRYCGRIRRHFLRRDDANKEEERGDTAAERHSEPSRLHTAVAQYIVRAWRRAAAWLLW